MATFLIVGESHTGKTQSLSTLPGKTILFNFEPPDNVSNLTVPFEETKSLQEWWKLKKPIERVVVVQYGSLVTKLNLTAVASPAREKITTFIDDINSSEAHFKEFDSFVIETLGPLAEEIMDFIVASNGRKDRQIQDYGMGITKLNHVLMSLMATGKNVVLTAHLQNERDELTGRGRTTPLVWGKSLPSTIPKWFSEVFCTVVNSDGKGGIKYQWLTKPEPGGFLTFLGSRRKKDLAKFIEQDFKLIF